MNEAEEQVLDEFLFSVTPEEAGTRLDKYLSLQNSDFSRAYFQKLLEQKHIEVNGKNCKPGYKLQAGDIVTCKIPPLEELKILPENIPLDIVYEDKDLIIINKEKGMVVHPAAGHYTGTLVNALMYHCGSELSGINGVIRPGIVHRIDQDTTGLLVICKNDSAHRFLAEQLRAHTITRTYHAVVYGVFQTLEGTVDEPIGRHPVHRKKMAVNQMNGKRAVTHYHVCETLQNKYSYITCNLETGRTHQIRVHMAYLHHPLLGDMLYGPEKSSFTLQGQALHAAVLGFIHPASGKYVEFHAPLPEYFTDLLDKLRK